MTLYARSHSKDRGTLRIAMLSVNFAWARKTGEHFALLCSVSTSPELGRQGNTSHCYAQCQLRLSSLTALYDQVRTFFKQNLAEEWSPLLLAEPRRSPPPSLLADSGDSGGLLTEAVHLSHFEDKTLKVLRSGKFRFSPSPRFPFPFFLKNARVFFKSVMEKRRLGRRKAKTKKNSMVSSGHSIILLSVPKGVCC